MCVYTLHIYYIHIRRLYYLTVCTQYTKIVNHTQVKKEVNTKTPAIYIARAAYFHITTYLTPTLYFKHHINGFVGRSLKILGFIKRSINHFSSTTTHSLLLLGTLNSRVWICRCPLCIRTYIMNNCEFEPTSCFV